MEKSYIYIAYWQGRFYQICDMNQELSKRLLKQLETELEQIAMPVSDPLTTLTTALKPINRCGSFACI